MRDEFCGIGSFCVCSSFVPLWCLGRIFHFGGSFVWWDLEWEREVGLGDVWALRERWIWGRDEDEGGEWG